MAHCHSHGSLLLRRLVCTRRAWGLLLVCACRTSAASVEPLPRGSRAVAFPRWLQVLSCSTWLIVRCCISTLPLCFGFMGANSNSIRRPASALRRSLRRCLNAAEPGATLAACHLDNDLVIIIYIYCRSAHDLHKPYVGGIFFLTVPQCGPGP